tara:strand:- start:107 stop:682 length:576 start_codon:yes stop_codon:yes gene_type:complete
MSSRLVLTNPKWSFNKCGLWLVCQNTPRPRTKASTSGITHDELVDTLERWDNTLINYKPPPSDLLVNTQIVDSTLYSSYLPKLLSNLEKIEDFIIIHIESEYNEKWVKYVLFNTKTQKYILRSATNDIPIVNDDSSVLELAKKKYGRSVFSQDDGWLINQTNIWSSKEFWIRLKDKLVESIDGEIILLGRI